VSSFALTGTRLKESLPSWDLVTTKILEIRRRRGLMIAVAILTLALPVLVLGIRLLFHAIDPHKYGPAGSPGIFQDLLNPMAEFGFIIASTVGAAVGTTDLTDGFFRQLVTTGRSRVALFLARIPAGLTILVPAIALAFTMVCLVTAYASGPPATTVNVAGINVPAHLDQSQLKSWIDDHPEAAANAFQNTPTPSPSAIRTLAANNIGSLYSQYQQSELSSLTPPINEMIKIGLWLELVVIVGFTVGLGLGALIGQRTVATILMIALELIVTPILTAAVIPYFLNGQRLLVGLALDQLRPAGLAGGVGGGGGPGGGHGGRILFGGRGVLSIPPMPTWAMIAVITGWIVGWLAIGAWRMSTRDA
jgi:hypothetical protein